MSFLDFIAPNSLGIVSKDQALVGREQQIVPGDHAVYARPMLNSEGLIDVPAGYSWIQLGMGCFWGAERKFWQLEETYLTAVGYAGGYTKNPTYEEVCSGKTGHTEVVAVVYPDKQEKLLALFETFWQEHNPTQGMRQGNDIGSQYRSAIYCSTKAQYELALQERDRVQSILTEHGVPDITTEINTEQDFYFAEPYHQQYLHKNPQGYCGLGGLGISLK